MRFTIRDLLWLMGDTRLPAFCFPLRLALFLHRC